MVTHKAVLKQIEVLKKVRKKDYTLEYTCTGNYHLMKGCTFIVIDESLEVISVVIKALVNDRKIIKKVLA